MLKGKLTLLFLFLVTSSYSSMIVTERDGKWHEGQTWNMLRSPVYGDTIIIKHYIEIDSDLTLYSPYFLIDTSGTLCGNITLHLIDSAITINNGVVKLYFLNVQGPFENNSFILLKGGGLKVSPPGRLHNEGPNGYVHITRGSHDCNDHSNMIGCHVPNAKFTYTVSENKVSFIADSFSEALYTWNFGDSVVISEIDKHTISHTYFEKGNYQVILIVKNNCGADTILQNLTLGNCNEIDFRIYPFPTADFLTLDVLFCSKQLAHFYVCDIFGTRVTENFFLSEKHLIEPVSVAGLTPGFYFVVLNVRGRILTKKIVLVNNH